MIEAAELGDIVAAVVEEYLGARGKTGRKAPSAIPSAIPSAVPEETSPSCVRGQAGKDEPVSSREILPVPERGKNENQGFPAKAEPVDRGVKNPGALRRMQILTHARIGVGRAGPRLRTETLLKLRADHAAARDAVFRDVSRELLDGLGFPVLQSRCGDRREHITRPDLGRQLSAESREILLRQGEKDRDLQVIVADGLSSRAVEANIANLFPVMREGLGSRNISMGKPFFVRYGRVAIEDEFAESLGAKLVCILIGERPGLATAESMSAYLCYQARVGQPESRRTVVSNIHANGLPAVEAGAYLTDLIEKILQNKASGIDFKK
ncbi:MAG: ethanolamine ammonia-lyase subunit EutC [Treponema sp.]|jgi:ethanolamine ammonia-lyase small subunit|nr:ethanolamine ammonia-lyase subunit EutC [Treponema sp.]